MASKTMNRAEETVEAAGEEAKGVLNAAAEKAGNAARVAEDKVNQGIHTVGEYLSEKNVRDMASDLGELIKKHPLASIAVGVGVGLLLASLLRR